MQEDRWYTRIAIGFKEFWEEARNLLVFLVLIYWAGLIVLSYFCANTGLELNNWIYFTIGPVWMILCVTLLYSSLDPWFENRKGSYRFRNGAMLVLFAMIWPMILWHGQGWLRSEGLGEHQMWWLMQTRFLLMIVVPATFVVAVVIKMSHRKPATENDPAYAG